MNTVTEIKELTVAEFKTLLARPDWKRRQYFEEVHEYEREDDEWDAETSDFITGRVPYTAGCAIVENTLKLPDGAEILISHWAMFSFDNYDPEHTLQINDCGWRYSGFYLIDEDGDEIDESDYEELVREYGEGEFEGIDFSELYPG